MLVEFEGNPQPPALSFEPLDNEYPNGHAWAWL